MSGTTNPDNGMMENQQAEDLGHPTGGDGRSSAKGASVESPIPHFPEGVDGMIEAPPERPGEATEEARRAALRTAEAQPRRRH